MANAFDQFDAPQPMPDVQAVAPAAAAATTQPQGNIFDQFDKPASPGLSAEQQAPGYQQAAKVAQATPDKPVQRNIVNDLTFNRAPQIAGAVSYADQAARNYLGGSDGKPTPDQAYEATRDVEKQRSGQYASDNPFANFAENVAGTMLNPVVGAAGRYVGGARSLLGSMVRSAATGAPIGAAYGAGANSDDPTSGAITGAAGGLVTGAAGPVVARGLSAVTNRAVAPTIAYARSLISPSTAPDIQAARTAAQQVGAAQAFAQRYNLTPERIADLAANNPDYQQGAPITAAELIGRNAVGDVRALATRSGGDAADTVLNTLQQRQYGDGSPLGGETGRLLDNISESAGVDPRTALSDHQTMIANTRDEVNPAYAAIRSNSGVVPQSQEMSDLIDSDPNIQRAATAVNNVSRGDIRLPLDPNNPDAGTGLNAADWLRVRSLLNRGAAYDEVTGRPPNDIVAQANTRAANDLTPHLNEAIPGLDDATARAATYKAPESAFDNASGMLFNNGKGKTVSDVQRLVDNVGTPEERVAIQRAFMNDIQNQANTGRGVASYLSRPGVRQKLAIVFSPDVAESIHQGALSAQRLAGRSGAAGMSPNAGSQTAETLAHQGELGDVATDAISRAVEGARHGGVTGGMWGAGTSLLKSGVGKALRAGQNPEYPDYAIRQLTRPAGEFVQTYTPPAQTPRPTLVSPGFAQFGAQMSAPHDQQISPSTASTKSLSSLGALSKSADQYLDPSTGVR